MAFFNKTGLFIASSFFLKERASGRTIDGQKDKAAMFATALAVVILYPHLFLEL